MSTNKSISAYILRNAKKLYLLKHYNSKCSMCEENRHWLLVFHHTHNKEFGVFKNLHNRFSSTLKEANKCVLLCQNCHREEHFKYGEDRRRTLNKIIMLEYKGTNKCSHCGYDRCIKTLDFHHIDPSKKEIGISRYINKSRYKNISSLENDIKTELDKCIVVCANCHSDIHYDHIKFLKYKNDIIEKSKNIKELRVPLNRDKIIKLYNSGKTVTEIAKIMKTGKSTICTITRKCGLGKSYAERGWWKEKAVKLFKEGKSGYTISKILNIHKGMVYEFLNSI